jgi:TIR domain/HEAT repeats
MAKGPHTYDVAISFAGEDRLVVERFAAVLAHAGFRIFYDLWERDVLWGKDLYQYLDEVYRKRSRFCVIFISAAYVQKAWTSHELRSAQARALEQKSEYLLPIRLDDTEIPGFPPTIAYVDARQTSVEDIAAIAILKVRDVHSIVDIENDLTANDANRRNKALSLVAVERLKEYLETVSKVLLQDPEPRVRERAAWALDNLKEPKAIPSLVAALNDEDFSVRSSAGWALVHLGSAAKPLVTDFLLSTGNANAREMAELILERM